MDPLAQTVEVRAFQTDEEMNRAMQGRLEAIYGDIFISAPVAGAREAYETAQQDVARLKKAQANLTERAREIFARMREVSSSLETGLIESHAGGKEFGEVAKSLNTL